MRIAHVSPLYESVPPRFYGGTERIVSYLTEEQVALGHEVSLFASGDSQTSATLIPAVQASLRFKTGVIDPLAIHYLMLEEVSKRANDFDIIHFHIDYLHFAITRRCHYPNVTTLHGRLDIPEVIQLHEEYDEMPLISISQAQRLPLRENNWLATVYHGIPLNLYNLNESPQQYLAFLGRISPEKRLDRAIQIAELAGLPLKVAAKVDAADKEYFESTIKPILRYQSSVEFLGEINDQEKQEFLGNALALLFPIDWPEPFGVVMIEAMACGTPVVAFPKGAVSEVIDRGKTGFIVKSLVEAAAVVNSLHDFDRMHCRAVFEQRFTAQRMAQNYLHVYETQLQRPCMNLPA